MEAKDNANICMKCKKVSYELWYHAQGFVCSECQQKGHTYRSLIAEADDRLQPD